MMMIGSMGANVDLWVERLKNAFSGMGTDEDEVNKVLGEVKGQISVLSAQYPENYTVNSAVMS